MRKKIGVVLVIVMLMTMMLPTVAQGATLVSREQISTGAQQEIYTIDTAAGETKAAVITVDLNDAYNYLQVIPGGGHWSEKATVSAMAVFMASGFLWYRYSI